MTKQQQYIDTLNELKKLGLSEYTSCTILQELCKDERMHTISAEKSQRHEESKGDLATDKQLKYLDTLGGQPYKGMTKKEASGEIERIKNLKPKWTQIAK